MKKKIAIVGAGITGIVIAKILSSKNFKIDLFEEKFTNRWCDERL